MGGALLRPGNDQDLARPVLLLVPPQRGSFRHEHIIARQLTQSAPSRTATPLFRRLDRLAVENRSRAARLPAHRLAQRHMQLGPDRLPDAITLELAKDVVDGRAGRKAVAGQMAPGARSEERRV